MRLQQIGLHPQALQLLQAYDWPGNVRELEHLLMRASLKAAREQPQRPLIRAEHLELQTYPPTATTPAAMPSQLVLDPGLGLRGAVERLERQLIEQALRQHEGNWSAAARALQLDRANLNRLAKRLGVQ